MRGYVTLPAMSLYPNDGQYSNEYGPSVGAPRIELGLSAPKADVLPVYYAPRRGELYHETLKISSLSTVFVENCEIQRTMSVRYYIYFFYAFQISGMGVAYRGGRRVFRTRHTRV